MKNKEWLEFRERPTLPDRKTKIFNVWSKSSKNVIGTISWYPQWRHYCFFPEEYTVYSDRCMIRIGEFVEELNNKHRLAKTLDKSDHSNKGEKK